MNDRFSVFAWLVLAGPLLIATPWLAAGLEKTETIPLVVEVGPEMPPSSTGRLKLTPLSAPGEALELPVGGKPNVRTELPAGTVWEVSAEIPGYWAAREIFMLPKAQTQVVRRLHLWPAGQVRGFLKMVEKGAPFPQEVALRFQSPPLPSTPNRVAESLATCPVTAEGAWRCEVPAAQLDLALRAGSFVPHYRWGVKVLPGKALDLGVLEMKKGASVAGRVEVEDGILASGKCWARLSPLLAPGGATLDAERLKRAVNEVPVDPRGFFQLAGIAPGSYLLEIEQAGFAPGRVFPLEVWEGSEILLKEPVVLRKPLDLEITLSPVTDWLGKPWHLRVYRASDFSASYSHDPAFQGPAGPEGSVKIAGQSPGTFWISVADSLGNQLFSNENIVIQGPEQARRTIELELVTVRGTVSLGDEPLAADLEFGGRSGAVRVSMPSNEDGEFHGILPRGGTWKVDVRAPKPEVTTHVRVEVKPDPQGKASLEIVLPDTLVYGKVLGDDEAPVPGARVYLESELDVLSVRADGNGTFEIRGAPDGLSALTARDSSAQGRRTSDPAVVTISESQALGPIELRLHKVKSVRGRVASPRGPIPGAMISLLPRRPALGGGAAVRTGPDGGFEAEVPGRAEILTATVSAPGHALKAFEFPADGSAVVLNVPTEGGTLEISIPYPPEEVAAQGLMTLIFQNGLPLPPGDVVRWTRGHGGGFEDPARIRFFELAEGEYRVCVTPRAVPPGGDVDAWLSQLPDCASGFLQTRATLRLELRRPG